jgi:hypothetical protein
VSVGLILMLLAPLAGAVFAWSFADAVGQRRFLVSVCAAAALGGAAYALVRTIDGHGVAWRGFVADPWHALLAAGALMSVAVAAAAAEAVAGDHPPPGEQATRAHLAQALVFATGAGAVTPLLVGSSHLLAVTLPLATVGLAASSLALAPDGPRALRARRAIVALATSDVLALVALGTALGSGAGLPPVLSTAAGGMLLAAALIRLGLVPIAWPAPDAARAHSALGLLWLGPVRAQGFLLLVFSLRGARGLGYAAAAAGAATAFASAWSRDAEDDAGAALASAGTGIAVLGFALGGPAALWGGILAAAGAFLAPVAWTAGHRWADGARPSLGVLPAGGVFAGAVAVLIVAFDAGARRPGFLALALPAGAGVIGVAGRALSARAPGRRGGLVLAGGTAGLALVAALALAALPEHATRGLAFPVADALDEGRLLAPSPPPGIGSDLGVVVVGAALLAFALGPGKTGTGGATARADTARFLAWWAAPGPAPSEGSSSARARADRIARPWGAAGVVLFVAAVVLALRLYAIAAGRGFL